MPLIHFPSEFGPKIMYAVKHSSRKYPYKWLAALDCAVYAFKQRMQSIEQVEIELENGYEVLVQTESDNSSVPKKRNRVIAPRKRK